MRASRRNRRHVLHSGALPTKRRAIKNETAPSSRCESGTPSSLGIPVTTASAHAPLELLHANAPRSTIES